jgi:4-hydroxybenzoate polyprenyltransferase
MTLIREVVKDMEDMKGDTTFGCKTLPIVWGIRKTKSFVYVIVVIFSILVLWLDYRELKISWIYFIPLLFLPMSVLVFRLIKADTKKEFYQLSQLCKIIMLLGIISMVFI